MERLIDKLGDQWHELETERPSMPLVFMNACGTYDRSFVRYLVRRSLPGQWQSRLHRDRDARPRRFRR